MSARSSVRSSARLTLSDLFFLEPKIQLLIKAAATSAGPWDLLWAGARDGDQRGLARRVAKIVGRHRREPGEAALFTAQAYEIVCDAVLAALWERPVSLTSNPVPERVL